MRIKLEVEFRRPARRTVALLLAGLLISLPSAAVANHQFFDVPNGHPFHYQIGAIAGAGIAAGFADGGYHPSEPVTRQAMAAFLHRGLGRVAMTSGTPTIYGSLVAANGVNTTASIPIRQVTIVVPGTPGPDAENQMVFVQGRVVFYDHMTATYGCVCEFGAFIEDMSNGSQSTWTYQVFDDDESAFLHYDFMVDGVFPATPGSRTFRLHVFVFSRRYIGVEGDFTFHDSTSLMAMTFPFGYEGTSEP